MCEDADRLRETRQISKEAATLAKRFFDDIGRVEIEQKGVQDFVTRADREVEALVRHRLAERFPGDGFLGEESGRTPGTGAWVVDPVDGTANFMRGLPTFAVSIAYVDDEAVPRVGVIEEVARGLTYAAHRGGGAFRNDDRLSVSTVDRLDRCAMSLGFWTKSPPDPFLFAARNLAEARCDVRRLGSACLALAYTAAGQTEGFWQWLINSWDVAAGILLVTEAGGRTTPFFESGGLDGPRPLLATNAALAEALAARVGASWDAEAVARAAAP
jgi:myo-inositol-1(or 4)-monophosphatase